MRTLARGNSSGVDNSDITVAFFGEVSCYFYVLVVENFNDGTAHKEALFKLINSLEKSGKAAEATSYKTQLQKEYPNYKGPTDL